MKNLNILKNPPKFPPRTSNTFCNSLNPCCPLSIENNSVSPTLSTGEGQIDEAVPWPDWGEGSAFAECEEEQLEAEDEEDKEQADEQANNGELDFVSGFSFVPPPPLVLLLLSTSRSAWQELSKRPGKK